MSHHSRSEATETAQRAAVYEFLGRLWSSEVDAALQRSLTEPSRARDAFLNVGGDLSEVDSSSVGIEELAEDYCRLFLGPTNHLPPYQSVWTDGQFAGEPSVQMKQWCEIAGIESSAIEPDQLGVQLTVMSRIVGSANATVEADFFEQHLRWPKELFAAAAERARTEFYRSVVKITSEFLQLEAERFPGTRRP